FLIHPPPGPEFHRYALSFVLPTTHIQPGYSYPSGHSLRMAFLFIIISSLIFAAKCNKFIKFFGIFVITAITMAMLISRVSLGEHWASDVVGGVILGALSANFALSGIQKNYKQ
ncbi:MAG: phosphatase PAP2 family protein, partial [bacterium]|nr:phosphatase PAP2 family protein [bacterium]